ncbi:MAG: hypothetical protein EP297_00155 [Gammaproteobacteria bacterium]|nr:MAG: hypothetical protein EP297_00155 [Gammaproteobacteria bacterium]
MVRQVDPFVIPIPRALLRDPEVRFYHQLLNKSIHDVWIRTGGGNDNISDQGIRELYSWQVPDDEESEGVTQGLYSMAFGGQTQTEILAISNDFTTTGDQIIICTNTTDITVTLNPFPDDGEEVYIKRQNTGNLLIVGDIDGKTSIAIISRYDSPHLVYTVDAGEWSII